MSSSETTATPDLLLRARKAVAEGRWGDAEMLFRQVLAAYPAHPEACNLLAVAALQRGEHDRAQTFLDECLARHPKDPSTWHNAGLVAHARRDFDAALAAFDRALTEAPEAHASWLYRGQALEQSGRERDAALAYLRALRLAQGKGRWVSPATTPPPVRPVVEHAIGFVQRHQVELFRGLLQTVRQRHDGDLGRVETCIEAYVGLRPARSPDPRQRPTLMYFPGLPAQPYLDRQSLPWLAEWEAQTPAIREELQAVLAAGSGHEAVFHTEALARQNLRNPAGVAKWDGFYFYRWGQRRDALCGRCPRTAAALERLPLARVRDNAPEVMFSVLTPGTHLLPHHGVTNTRVVAHLPIIVPEGCALTVGGEQHVWREGEAVVFDDTYSHEAWNRGSSTRVVLIADVWHPGLTEAERAAIAEVSAAVSDFNRASSSLQPAPA
jgi:aspartate beta-hydroxylase